MGNVRRPIAPMAVAVPLLLLTACSGDEPPPVAEPTSAFGPTGSTGPTTATGSTGTTDETGGTIEDLLPTTTAGAATGKATIRSRERSPARTSPAVRTWWST